MVRVTSSMYRNIIRVPRKNCRSKTSTPLPLDLFDSVNESHRTDHSISSTKIEFTDRGLGLRTSLENEDRGRDPSSL